MRLPKTKPRISNAKYFYKRKHLACPHCKEARNVMLCRLHAECYSCETCGAVFDKDTRNYYFPKGEKPRK